MEVQSGQPVIEMTRELAEFLVDAGADQVIALDVSSQSSFADAFLIAGANSEGQLQGFQRQLVDELADRGVKPHSRRRRSEEGGWVLMDCGNLIIHLFLPEQREFYDLEKLWFDAPRLFEVSQG